MGGAADTARGKAYFTGFGFGELHQFGTDFAGTDGCTASTKRLAADDGHRDDVALDVEGQVFVQRRRVGNADALQQQRVAVGRGLGGDLGGDHAAAAGAVVDDDLLAQTVGQFLREQPRDDVGAAARGGSREHAHRAFGECGGAGAERRPLAMASAAVQGADRFF